MNKGFTLIELLVVVLIIGILAAIALPQYTRAVERSRMSEAVQTLGDLATAESIYFMQTNTFADASKTSAMPGDISLSLPDDDNGWTITATAYDETAKDDYAILTAKRNAGMYAEGELYLKVNNDGAITKCVKTGAEQGFKDIAKTAGYETAAASATACGA